MRLAGPAQPMNPRCPADIRQHSASLWPCPRCAVRPTHEIMHPEPTSTLAALVRMLRDLDLPAPVVTAVLDSGAGADLTTWLNDALDRCPHRAGDRFPDSRLPARFGRWVKVGSAPEELTMSAAGSTGRAPSDCVTYEPAFAADVLWALSDGISRLRQTGGGSTYLRVSPRPVNQALARLPSDAAARERRGRQVCAGAYIVRLAESPMVTLVATGIMITEVVTAADRLAEVGVQADVVCVTAPGRLLAAVQAHRGVGSAPSWILDQVFPAVRAAPMVMLLDGDPQALGFLATVNNVPGLSLCVSDPVGQPHDPRGCVRHRDVDDVVRAAVDLLL